MSIINSQPLIGASGQGGAYNLTRSLRFRSSASAYLNRTPASAGNRKTWTWSAWVKKANYPNGQAIFSAGTDANAIYIEGGNDGTIGIDGHYNGTRVLRYTTAAFRDFSAWYHVVVVLDTTQATDSNRIKLYVNGVQITLATAVVGTWPAQNSDGNFNSNVAHSIGRRQNVTDYYYDGYLAENHFVDGQALTPSDFGETDTATGVWKPKKYTGTYGTNGFYLKFDNLTSTSTLGNDSSGNSNTWTVNNISLTSGSTYDSMKDVPTLTDADTANYCVINPLRKNACTISNGNLTASGPSQFNKSVVCTMTMPANAGKYYWEAIFTRTSTSDGGVAVGIASTSWNPGEATGSPSILPGQTSDSWGVEGNSGSKGTNNSFTSYGSSFASGDVIMIAYDAVNGSFYVGKNGTWFNSGDPAANTGYAFTGITTEVLPAFSMAYDTGSSIVNANFGQRPFAYTPPSGFKALNTFNLPTPTIGATASTQANKYFDATLYTANNSTQTIVNTGGFKPDFVWEKSRANAYSHQLFDSVRGVGKYLFTDQTAAEGTDATSLTAFNSNGYSVGATANANLTNGTSSVGWQWRASNATGVSNTSGSITSTVSANTTAGFSIVTYTGTGSNATVGHGLGVAPKMVIVKCRNTAGENWQVYNSNLTSAAYRLRLNTTDAEDSVPTMWNSTAPTSSVFSVGTQSGVNGNTQTYVAYCFAEVAGYSKFGSYTGNGSTDGTFVFTGFRPRYLLVKRTDTTSVWSIWDTARNTINAAGSNLWTDSSEAETTSTAYDVDFLSNGFKLRNSHAARNASGGTYIYAAFAENPFKYSLAR